MQFTFGIELELVCVFKPSAFENLLGLHPERERVSHEFSMISSCVVAHCLSQAGLKASSHDWSKDEKVVPYTTWKVKHDDSVQLTPAEFLRLPDDWISDDIEIVSPILSSNTSEWQEQLRTVLQTLQRMTENLDCQFLVNSTTGLHIHLGNNGGEELPLDFSKRILQFMTAFERNIDTIHPTNRLPAPGLDPPNLDAMVLYFNPLSYFHKYNSEAPNGGNIFSWLHNIENAEKISDLGNITTATLAQDFDHMEIPLNGHDSTVNLDNLFKTNHLNHPTNTIEFRQHSGSLDLIEITSWIEFLLHLANFCEGVSDVEFMNLLTQSVNVDFDLNDLLTAIDCDVDTRLYYGIRPSIQTLRNRHSCLDELVKQNISDREQAFEETRSRVEQKYVGSYYGIDPLACNSMSWEDVTELLEYSFPAFDASLARKYVLEELAEMYGAGN